MIYYWLLYYSLDPDTAFENCKHACSCVLWILCIFCVQVAQQDYTIINFVKSEAPVKSLSTFKMQSIHCGPDQSHKSHKGFS